MKKCLTCNEDTHSKQDYCLPCLFTNAGVAVPRFALTLRLGTAIPFRPRVFAGAFTMLNSQFLNSNFFVIKDSLIIKVREQVQQEQKESSIQGHGGGGKSEDKWPTTSEDEEHIRRRDRCRRIIHRILTGYGNRCWYCGRPADATNKMTVDSVLPTGMDHSTPGYSGRQIYYEALDRAKNARPACYRCNFIKGLYEMRGLRLLRKILRGEREIKPVRPLPPRPYAGYSAAAMLNSLQPPAEHKRGPLTPEEARRAALLLALAALRITCKECCQHKPVGAYYDSEARTLAFRCGLCGAGYIPIFTVSGAKPAELERHQKYLKTKQNRDQTPPDPNEHNPS